MIIYKDILKKLSEKGYTTYRLRKEKIIGEHIIQAIRENKPVNITTIDKICALLDCQPSDLLEYVKEK